MAHYKGAASEAGRAMQLLKKREQAQMEIEYRKKKIEEELKISNIENKFAAHYDAVEQQLKTSTIGLVTLDEMKAKQENIVKERERKLAQKQAEKEREQQRQLEAKQAERNRQKRQKSNYISESGSEEESVKKFKKPYLESSKPGHSKFNQVPAQRPSQKFNQEGKGNIFEFKRKSNHEYKVSSNFDDESSYENSKSFFKQKKTFYNRGSTPNTKSSIKLNYEVGKVGDEEDENSDKEEEDDENNEEYPKKRENKNRPKELSSKIPARSKLPKPVNRVDPRFDNLCGSFDEQFFNKAYSFLGDYKENELKKLKKMYRRTKSPKVRSEIGFLIERLTNQKRAQEKNDALKKNKKEEKEAYIKAILEGQHATFPKRQENSVMGLLQDFKELQQAGKLQKYIQKKSKRRSKNSEERGFK